MIDDIDQALRDLVCQPLPSALTGLERRVMARIEAESAARATLPSLGVGIGTAAIALVLGITTASAPAGADAAALQISVFSPNAALAPATLLAVTR